MQFTVGGRRKLHLDNDRHAMLRDVPPLLHVLVVLARYARNGFGGWAAARRTGCRSHDSQLIEKLHAPDAGGGAGYISAEARVLHLYLNEVDPVNRLRCDDPIFDTGNLYMHHLLEDDVLHGVRMRLHKST